MVGSAILVVLCVVLVVMSIEYVFMKVFLIPKPIKIYNIRDYASSAGFSTSSLDLSSTASGKK